MKNNGYKPRVPDIMEAVFDIGYLLFDLIAAVLFFVFSRGNSLFVLYGILTLTRMVAAILISFGCYLPVTLMSKKHPKVGLLMIPKTCAYIWIIAMGLELLF